MYQFVCSLLKIRGHVSILLLALEDERPKGLEGFPSTVEDVGIFRIVREGDGWAPSPAG